MKPVTLELGGKSANIVLDDADLDLAAACVLWGTFFHNGQVCESGTRALVHSSIYDDFLSLLVDRAGKIVVGNQMDFETDLGPLVGRSQVETVERYVALGREEVGEPICGGARPEGLAEGLDEAAFYTPTIFAGVPNSAKIAQEEIFGPVLSVLGLDDVDEAVAIANDTRYGLSGGVWGADADEAKDVAQLVMALRKLADANGFDKIIVMASHDDWQAFLRFGYVLEAVLEYYHCGEDAFVVSKFRSQERLDSPNLMDETLLIEQIAAREISPRKSVPEGYTIRLARREDIFSLLDLYQEIFDSYPSPLKHASYLEHIFQKESLFAVCLHDGAVVAAASAELMPGQRAAELTDCATRKEARGKGLMSHLLIRLEEELCRRAYVCAYTMARGRSYGMNSVFFQLGYEYTGRLINNCDIYGAYEDMNIWVKDLRPLQRPDDGGDGPEVLSGAEAKGTSA